MATSMVSLRSLIAARKPFVFYRSFSRRCILFRKYTQSRNEAQSELDYSADDARPSTRESTGTSDADDSHVTDVKRQSRWMRMRQDMRDKYDLAHGQSELPIGDQPVLDLKKDATKILKQPKNSVPFLESSHSYDDYFGIESESESSNTRPETTVEGDFSFLHNPIPENAEKLLQTTYGTLRLDSDNQPRTSKRCSELSNNDDQSMLNPQTGEEGDEDFVEAHPSTVPRMVRYQNEQRSDFLSNESRDRHGDENYFDHHYFSVEDTVDKNFSNPPRNILASDSDSHHLEPSPQIQSDISFNASSCDSKSETHLSKPVTAAKDHLAEEEKADNLFDEHYFSPGPTQADDVRQGRLHTSESVTKNTNNVGPTDDSSINFFDEVYFPAADPVIPKKSAQLDLQREQKPIRNDASVPVSDNMNIFDDQYFSTSAEVEPRVTKPVGKTAMDYVSSKSQSGSSHDTDDVFGEVQQRPSSDWHSSSLGEEPLASPPVTKQEQRFRERHKFNIENPRTAYDLSKQIQQEKITPVTGGKNQQERDGHPVSARGSKWTGEVDSKGFRKLKNQVINVQNIPEDVLVSILRDSVLYEDESVVAIDKPYGLPSHGGPKVHNSVAKLLPRLAQKLDHPQDSQLRLVHRLDKETTGVMVLAKTEEVYQKLLMMFKKRLIFKRYWMLTKGVPNPLQGVIDIPMAEGTVGNLIRMTLKPHYTDETKLIYQRAYQTRKLDAITEYRVLDSSGTTALVECEPKTGVKHQIRCHMAFALNTPILGDHKFSHFSKLAPQRLNADALQRLGIRQATVRYVPMHLHAKQLIIPEMKDGRNLFLSARLPKHFAQNMKWLKIKPPKL